MTMTYRVIGRVKWWYRSFEYCFVKYHVWFNREPNWALFRKVLDKALVVKVVRNDQ